MVVHNFNVFRASRCPHKTHAKLIIDADMEWGLGAEETAALSYAQHNRDYTAIVDDREARRCASILNISLIGTAGVVVLTRRRGLIDSMEVALRQLQGAGLWMLEQLIVKLAADDKAAQ